MKMPLFLTSGVAALAVLGALALILPTAAETARQLPPPVADEAADGATRTAVFAGGCFWGVQGVFQHVEGVTSAVSGYAGGEASTAKYEKVSRGVTRHAEAVRVTYDPRKITFGALMQIYFSVAHDPTELHRQGPDIGPQYRSTIFANDEEQARLARSYIDQLDGAKAFPRKIATTIERGRVFYPAENYHQDYLVLHPRQ
ncbi:MAG TPA: peptide-methionine (S)-S-oxide reductase MsrA, partial [Reyranella sp.]|nr:peptide-methionine (S)-S-oxide reductase MsrA [Reyranella sp.]